MAAALTASAASEDGPRRARAVALGAVDARLAGKVIGGGIQPLLGDLDGEVVAPEGPASPLHGAQRAMISRQRLEGLQGLHAVAKSPLGALDRVLSNGVVEIAPAGEMKGGGLDSVERDPEGAWSALSGLHSRCIAINTRT